MNCIYPSLMIGLGCVVFYMTLIPAYWIAISLALAGTAWIVFARSQHGRFHANVLPWLSIPYFVVAVVYVYFSAVAVEIELRAAFARYGFVILSTPQAIILILLFFLNRGGHGQSR